MKNIKIAQTTIVVSMILILSKISGFSRDIAMAYAYGTSTESDAFVVGLSVVNIFSMFFSAMTIAFMPVYKNYRLEDRKDKLNSFLNCIYSILGLSTVVVAFYGYLLTESIVKVISPGFEGQTYELTVEITKILMLTIPFTCFVTIQCQQLRGENCFIIPAGIAIPLNIILIYSFVFNSTLLGIQRVAQSYVIGTILQSIFLFSCIRWKFNYHFHISVKWKNDGISNVFILTFPILLGNAIQSINTIVDRTLASSLPEGSMAALNFSDKLSTFIIGIISLGAGNICFARMSELSASKNYAELTCFLKKVINYINLIVIPATVGMMVLSEPIVQTVFQHGAFDGGSRQTTATSFFFYAIGITAYSLREMITRTFYALRDSKTPMINGFFSVAINIVGDLILVEWMGVGGLALATSISAIGGTLLLLYRLRKKVGKFGESEILKTFLKICGAAAFMGGSVYLCYPLFCKVFINLPIALGLSISMGIFIYLIILLFLNISEVTVIKSSLRRLYEEINYEKY